MINVEELDPNIRKTVEILKSFGFETTDSGDGFSKFQTEEPMGCALDFPNIFMVVKPENMVSESHTLLDLIKLIGKESVLGKIMIETNYSPIDETAILCLYYFSDDDLNEQYSTFAPDML